MFGRLPCGAESITGERNGQPEPWSKVSRIADQIDAIRERIMLIRSVSTFCVAIGWGERGIYGAWCPASALCADLQKQKDRQFSGFLDSRSDLE
jgi:hypothetical protein